MIKNRTKNVLYTKNIFKKAKSIESYLTLLYFSNCQILLKISSSKVSPPSMIKQSKYIIKYIYLFI